jgi:hypothetical protein
MAYSPLVMKAFGPLMAQCVHEDDALGLRASMLGPFAYLEKKLVRYRIHGANLFGANDVELTNAESIRKAESRWRKEVRSRLLQYEQFATDIRVAERAEIVNTAVGDALMRMAGREIKVWSLRKAVFEGSACARIRALIGLHRTGTSPAELRRLALRSLPEELFYRLRITYNETKRMLSNVHGGH